jgi:hypothetical protein
VLHDAAARSRCQPTRPASAEQRRELDGLPATPLRAASPTPHSDMKHLEKVIKSVKTVSGVLDVERVYR